MYDVVVKKFTFAISSPDEFLLIVVETRRKDTECEKVAQDHCGKHCLCVEVAQSVAHWTSNVCNRRLNTGRSTVTH